LPRFSVSAVSARRASCVSVFFVPCMFRFALFSANNARGCHDH
jgi:hypothetical protein